MNDIEKALRKRFAQVIENSDWTILTGGQPPVTPVRVWLYSISVQSGPRVASQLSTTMYRDMVNGSNLFDAASNGIVGEAPELLLRTLDDIDAGAAHLAGKDRLELLNMAVAYFARTTQTWKLLPKPSDADGIHFAVIDWRAKDGSRVIRPTAMVGEGLLTVDEMVELTQSALETHMARRPDQAPMDV